MSIQGTVDGINHGLTGTRALNSERQKSISCNYELHVAVHNILHYKFSTHMLETMQMTTS